MEIPVNQNKQQILDITFSVHNGLEKCQTAF